MVTELEEKHFWQKKEDQEQMSYLKWRHENVSLKNAMRELARMREEYVLSRRICQGYQSKGISTQDLTDALSAAFILERHSVVTKEGVEKVINDYLSPVAKKQLKGWQTEQKEFYGADPLPPDASLSPVSVARLAARLMARSTPEGCYEVPEVKTNPINLAVYFALQAQQPQWNLKSKQIFQKLALDLTKQHLNTNAHGMMQNLVWKEMHDIIIKKQVSPIDHARFELIGRAGQQFGIDLEDKLLAARQEQLSDKP